MERLEECNSLKLKTNQIVSPGSEQHRVIFLTALSCQILCGGDHLTHVQLFPHGVFFLYDPIVTLCSLVVADMPGMGSLEAAENYDTMYMGQD